MWQQSHCYRYFNNNSESWSHVSTCDHDSLVVTTVLIKNLSITWESPIYKLTHTHSFVLVYIIVFTVANNMFPLNHHHQPINIPTAGTQAIHAGPVRIGGWY
jgi:hypothetical protein